MFRSFWSWIAARLFSIVQGELLSAGVRDKPEFIKSLWREQPTSPARFKPSPRGGILYELNRHGKFLSGPVEEGWGFDYSRAVTTFAGNIEDVFPTLFRRCLKDLES